MVTLGDEQEDRVNVLVWVTVELNTDLESVTTELDQTQDRLMEAHERIPLLEAQFAGEAPSPAQENEPSFLGLSPLCKKLRYGEPGKRTHYL